MSLKVLFFFFILFPFSGLTQLLNGDFEDWQEPFGKASHKNSLLAFGVKEPQRSIANHWKSISNGTSRINESCHGHHALLIYSWYHGAKSLTTQTFPVTTNPTVLKGCYKYLHQYQEDNIAIKYIEIVTWKANDTIGYGRFNFAISDDFQNFELRIDYPNEAQADSATIIIFTDINGRAASVDGLLFIDNLKLEATISLPLPTTVGAKNKFDIFYNSPKNRLHINCLVKGNFSFEIFDLQGQLLKTGKLPQLSNHLDIIPFPEGLYLFNIVDQRGQRLVGKFLKIYSN